MHGNKRTLLFVTILLIFIAGSLYVSWTPHTTMNSKAAGTSQLRPFTLQELAQYDGSSSTLPIYIGLDGYVYDVTLGKKFYEPGAVYHYLAGKDSSKSLHIMGGETIKQKYPMIGILDK